jgi:acyl dehydratase
MLWFDDIKTGTVVDLGAHEFKAEEIVGFAMKFDPQPFHVSEAAGKASHFGGLAASGWHSAAVWQMLFTRYRNSLRADAAQRGEAIPPEALLPGVSDLRWQKPVLAGDTLAYRVIIGDTTIHTTDPGWGVVVAVADGTNQRGELAFRMTARWFVKVRA